MQPPESIGAGEQNRMHTWGVRPYLGSDDSFGEYRNGPGLIILRGCSQANRHLKAFEIYLSGSTLDQIIIWVIENVVELEVYG